MIIVAGATGFIGSYLVTELVNSGIQVIATGRNKDAEMYFNHIGVPFQKVDICNNDDCKKLPTDNVEAVVLLAGLLPANVKEYNPIDYIKVNVEGTINMLEYCRVNGINKMISTTTYADVRKAWKKDEAITESVTRDFDYTGDHAMYVISKNAATDIIEHYSQAYGIKGIVFRLPPVYGVGPHGVIYADGQYYKSGIHTFIDNAIKGDDIEIWGDPNISRDVVYIKDVVHAIIAALKSEKAQGLYNITSGQLTTLEEQVRNVIEVFSSKDRKSQIVYRPEKKNTTPSYLFDIKKAKNDFGYNPRFIPFKKMLEDYKQEMVLGKFHYLESRNLK